jgi:hypothetical protein
MCAPRDQRESRDDQREQPRSEFALRIGDGSIISRGCWDLVRQVGIVGIDLVGEAQFAECVIRNVGMAALGLPRGG